MSYSKPVTYTQLKTLIQAEVEQNTDTPDSNDVAYWLVIINRLISDWEELREWKELWTYETSGGTLTAGDTTYPMNAAVRRLSEVIELVDSDGNISYIPVIESAQKQHYTAQQVRAAYVTGVAGSYVLNLTWTPQSTDSDIGATIKYPYYKYATKLSADADVVEMSDPNWLVDATVAEVSNQPFKKQTFDARAQAKMRQMLFNNEDAEDQTIPDDELGFGT